MGKIDDIRQLRSDMNTALEGKGFNSAAVEEAWEEHVPLVRSIGTSIDASISETGYDSFLVRKGETAAQDTYLEDILGAQIQETATTVSVLLADEDREYVANQFENSGAIYLPRPSQDENGHDRYAADASSCYYSCSSLMQLGEPDEDGYCTLDLRNCTKANTIMANIPDFRYKLKVYLPETGSTTFVRPFAGSKIPEVMFANWEGRSGAISDSGTPQVGYNNSIRVWKGVNARHWSGQMMFSGKVWFTNDKFIGWSNNTNKLLRTSDVATHLRLIRLCYDWIVNDQNLTWTTTMNTCVYMGRSTLETAIGKLVADPDDSTVDDDAKAEWALWNETDVDDDGVMRKVTTLDLLKKWMSNRGWGWEEQIDLTA